MRYKQLSILLLLQIFLFIQCSTAETSNKDKEKDNNKNVHGLIDTNSSNAAGAMASDENIKAADDQKNEAAKSQESVKQNLKQVEFGFNVGYLSDLQKADLYKKTLTQIKQDGITDLRIYEPFTKNVVKKPGLAENLLRQVTQAGFKILLCLSNYPDVPSIQYKQAENSSDQNAMRTFTNRRAPENVSAFQTYLTGFLDNLQSKNLLQNVSFEIGNEPDAKRYFWGKTDDFIKIAKSVKQSLAKYGKPVYCCGFTSNFANASSSKSVDYYNFLNDNTFFDNVDLSFHFYKDQSNDITKIRLPRLNNAIITEFNLFSAQKASSVNKNNITNSPEFGSVLIKALVFAYKNNIKKIYLFKLADTPGKKGTFGFFDENGNAKPSYQYFKNIYAAVKDGYTVNNTDTYISLAGTQQTVLYALANKVPIPNKQIISSSGNISGKNLNYNQWIVYKN